MLSNRAKGHLSIAVTNIIFGVNILVVESLLKKFHIGADILSLLRMLFGMVAFWVLFFFLPRQKVAFKDLFLLFLCGLFGILLNQLSFIVGMQYTDPINASLVITITPVLVMILAAVILKEPITWIKVGGVSMGLIGAAMIIVAGKEISFSLEKNWGAVFCFLSSLFYAIYLVINKPLLKKYAPTTILRWMFTFAAVVYLPIVGHKLPEVVWSSFPAEAYWEMAYLLIGATFTTYFLIGISLQYLRPTTLSTYNYLQPIVASLLAILLFGEQLTWIKIVAATLIFGGVFLVTRSKSRQDMEKKLRNQRT